MLSLVAAAPLAAQQAPAANANGNAGANAPAAPANPNAAARAANDGLRGVSKEGSLLGGPGAYRDPYRTTLDGVETQETDLMRAERVPNRAMDGNGYAPLPPGGRKPVARQAGADAGAAVGGVGGAGAGNAAGMAGNAAGGGGNVPPDTPQQATQSLYRDPFSGANGAGQQVYRSPW